jgi:putative ABC transport system permease protein
MLGYAWHNVRAFKRRLLGTGAAIALGVGLIAGTLVATDTVTQVIGKGTAGPARLVDVTVVDRRSPVTGSAVDDIAWIPDLLESGRLTPIPDRLVDELRSVEGVASATGVAMAPVELLGRDRHVVTGQGIPIARSVDDTFSGFVDSGRLPAGPRDVILDRATAASQSLRLGDPVSIVLPDGQAQEFTLVGTVDDAGFLGNLLVGFAPSSATGLLGRPDEYGLVELQASPGVDDEELRAAIDRALGADHGTITGTALRDWRRAEATKFTGILRNVISVAGAVALVLGSFVIRNTFTIVLASRSRELALLRCIGSTRRQIRRLLLLEAAVIGIIASAAGLALGVGLAALLGLLIDADHVVAVPVTGTSPVVTVRTVAVAAIAGTASAVLSALGAARRATRVSPSAALRDDVHGVSRREGRIRTIIGFGLITVGCAAITTAHVTGVGAGPMAVGTIALSIGIVTAGPMLARAFARLLGAPLARLFGVTGDLARDNSSRNPRRTSATILPLAFGLAFLIAFTVFTVSLTAPLADDFNTAWKADLRFTARTGGSQPSFTQLSSRNQLAPDVVDRLNATDALATVVALQTSPDYTVPGHRPTTVTGVDAAELPDVMQLTVVDGSLDQVHSGAIAISTDAADDYRATVGTDLDVDTPNGRARFVVRAIYRRPAFSAAGEQFDLIDELPYGHLLVSPADYRRTTGRTGVDTVFANVRDGVSTATAELAVERALRDHPTVQVATRDGMLREIFSPLDDGAFRFYYGLVGLMTVIAFVGIANTLALSITERRREIGLLRAIGLDRRQTRTVVRLEATITATAAVTIAVVLGLLYGHIFTEMQDIPAMLPARQLPLIALGTIGVVVAIADRPARRAGRLPTLTAIATE